MEILLGNIVALLSTILLGLSTFYSSKNTIMKFQIGDCFLSIITFALTGGMSGAIVSFLDLLRTYLVLKDKKSKILTALILGTAILVNILTWNKNLVEVLPIIAFTQYTLATTMLKLTAQTIKKALLVNLTIWLVYNTYLLIIPYIIADIILIVTTTINLIRFKNKPAYNK